MNTLLRIRWLAIAVRVSLGCIFIISSWPKIADPPAFAQMVSNYKLLPEYMVGPTAIVLPWLEMIAGIALVFGIIRHGAALWIGVMLVVFVIAISINIARGVPVDCGCFSLTASQKTHEELMATMKIDLIRDVGMLAMALFAFLTPVCWRKAGA